MTFPRRVVDLLVSIDTEEDNWHAVRNGISTENVRELPALALFFESIGIRPTYFVNYQVASRPWAADLLREITAGGRGEIGAHLHPWNTPPIQPESWHGDTMLLNYPLSVQSAKLATVTDALEKAFGRRPTTFRAGRFGLGRETVSALLAAGYRVDSSVTPYRSWFSMDRGPNFIGAPLDCYALDGSSDVRAPVAGGTLAEVPLTSGFNRFAVEHWNRLAGVARTPWVRAFRIPGAAARFGVVRRTMLSPENTSVADMLALARSVIDGGTPMLQLFFHATSLRPGLTPFNRSRREITLLYRRIDRVLRELDQGYDLRFRTVGECGEDVFRDRGTDVPRARVESTVRTYQSPLPRLRSPRVVILCEQFTSSRVGKWRALGADLLAAGWEIHVAAMGDGDGNDLLDGIRVHRLGSPWSRARILHHARRLTRQFDPDVLITTGPTIVVHLSGRAIRLQRPVAWLPDLDQEAAATNRAGRTWRRAFTGADGILVSSESAATALRSVVGQSVPVHSVRETVRAEDDASVREGSGCGDTLDTILRNATRRWHRR